MRSLSFALVLVVALTGCQPHKADGSAAPELTVSDAVIRLAAVEGRPGAAYFTLHGGTAPDRLVAVTSPKVATIELHENRMEGGMMSMKPLTGADILANQALAFKPGGNHAMLFGVDPVIRPGDRVPLHFIFQSGTARDTEALAIAAGDAMPDAH